MTASLNYANMPSDLLKSMKKIWVCGQQLNISHEADGPDRTSRHHQIRASDPQPDPAEKHEMSAAQARTEKRLR